MAKTVSESELNKELKESGNLINTFQGYVDLPEGFDENQYYYYRNDSRLIPVIIVGGMIRSIGDNTQMNGPSAIKQNIRLFTLKDMPQGPKLQACIEAQGTEYSSTTPETYIEAARKYATLRERLMHKMITVEEAAILFQGNEELLPSTKSSYSLGYNEDAYIKSSIAYETEMYLRSIFSSHGLLEPDMQTIFGMHDLKDAFLKLPRSIKTQVYQAYEYELRRRAIEENVNYFKSIVQDKNLETLVKQQRYDKTGSVKAYLNNVVQAFDFIRKDVAVTPEAEELIKRIKESLEEPTKKTNESNETNSETHDEKQPKNNNESVFKHTILSRAYLKYEKASKRYEDCVRNINNINFVIKHHLQKIKELKATKQRLENQYKNNPTEEKKKELDEVLNSIQEQMAVIEKYKEKISYFSNLISEIEDEMTSYIFSSELGMQRAYQDNRYTYETETNNNYDNMLILLNCIKRVVGGENISLPDYRSELEAIAKQDESLVIRTTQAEIQVFNRMFSRNDQTFTVNGRKTKTGQISRFFPSKKEPKLDALYSAELRYLGALQTKEENDNIFIAEIALASELYLKSLISDSEETHKLNDLYSKLENDDKLAIVEIVNNILGTTYDNNEFEEIISKKGISQAFEDYRYIYENVPIKDDIEFLTAFVQALHIITEKKLNYKSPYYDEIERTIHPEEDEFHR